MHSVPALPLLLKQLGLPTMFDSWEVEEQNALKNKWTHSEYLSVLSDKEATNRQQKRVERHIREAKLIPGKTLDSFDFDAAKSINAAQIKALAENTSWVKQAENLIIFGPSTLIFKFFKMMRETCLFISLMRVSCLTWHQLI